MSSAISIISHLAFFVKHFLSFLLKSFFDLKLYDALTFYHAFFGLSRPFRLPKLRSRFAALFVTTCLLYHAYGLLSTLFCQNNSICNITPLTLYFLTSFCIKCSHSAGIIFYSLFALVSSFDNSASLSLAVAVALLVCWTLVPADTLMFTLSDFCV